MVHLERTKRNYGQKGRWGQSIYFCVALHWGDRIEVDFGSIAMTTAERIKSPAVMTETMGDFLKRLGDISPDRIRMHPAPGTATVEDVVSIDDHEDRLFELVEGVLVEKGMGYYESLLAMRIAAFLSMWVTERDLGLITGEAGMVRLFGREVRIPDVAYASWERLGGRIPEEAVPLLAPELVVEVLSKSNTKREMDRKRGEYFKAGVRLVWVVDGKKKTVAVYTGAEQVKVLNEHAVLDGGDILPGFTLSLREVFAKLSK
jgi:Uma2 family endonuclease